MNSPSRRRFLHSSLGVAATSALCLPTLAMAQAADQAANDAANGAAAASTTPTPRRA